MQAEDVKFILFYFFFQDFLTETFWKNFPGQIRTQDLLLSKMHQNAQLCAF